MEHRTEIKQCTKKIKLGCECNFMACNCKIREKVIEKVEFEVLSDPKIDDHIEKLIKESLLNLQNIKAKVTNESIEIIKFIRDVANEVLIKIEEKALVLIEIRKINKCSKDIENEVKSIADIKLKFANKQEINRQIELFFSENCEFKCFDYKELYEECRICQKMLKKACKNLMRIWKESEEKKMKWKSKAKELKEKYECPVDSQKCEIQSLPSPEIEKHIQTLELEIKDLCSKNFGKESLINDMRKEIADLKSDNEKLIQEINKLQEKIEEQGNKLSECNKKTHSMNSDQRGVIVNQQLLTVSENSPQSSETFSNSSKKSISDCSVSNQVFLNSKGIPEIVLLGIISADLKYAVISCSDLIIKVWNLRKQQSEFQLTGHSSQIRALAISSDNSILVSGSSDKTLRVWNFSQHMLNFTLLGHTASIKAVAISSNSKLIVSGSEDLTIRIWDIDTRRMISLLKGHLLTVYSLALTLDDNFIVSGSKDRTIRIWSIAQKRQELAIGSHQAKVNSVAISNDSTIVLSGSDDGVVKGWHFVSRKEIFSILAHTAYVTCVTFSHNSQLFASGSGDKSIKVWNLKDKSLLIAMMSGMNWPTVYFSHDDQEIIAVLQEVSVWSLKQV